MDEARRQEGSASVQEEAREAKRAVPGGQRRDEHGQHRLARRQAHLQRGAAAAGDTGEDCPEDFQAHDKQSSSGAVQDEVSQNQANQLPRQQRAQSSSALLVRAEVSAGSTRGVHDNQLRPDLDQLDRLPQLQVVRQRRDQLAPEEGSEPPSQHDSCPLHHGLGLPIADDGQHRLGNHDAVHRIAHQDAGTSQPQLS